MKYVVHLSGGITSWAAAKRIKERLQPGDEMVLLFADTGIEDEDCYRFLHEGAANIGLPLTIIADGRTPWQVFEDEKFIGNSRIDPCSKILKRGLLDKWRKENCDPANTMVVVGILWDESHRIERLQKRETKWQFAAPLCDKPWISKNECLDWAEREGIKVPRMYAMGFAHANCGGFCVKAGHGHFKTFLAHFPERYLEHEEKELALMEKLGSRWGVMKDRRGGETKPLTMRQFRHRVEQGDVTKEEELDLGGCACAIE